MATENYMTELWEHLPQGWHEVLLQPSEESLMEDDALVQSLSITVGNKRFPLVKLLPKTFGPLWRLKYEAGRQVNKKTIRLLWRTNMEPKGQEILWKILLRVIPIRMRLPWLENQDCPFCGQGIQETIEHAFATCKMAKVLWDWIPWTNLTGVSRPDIDLVFRSGEIKSQSQILILGCLFWVLWKRRCSMIFDGKSFYIGEVKDHLTKLIVQSVEPSDDPLWTSNIKRWIETSKTSRSAAITANPGLNLGSSSNHVQHGSLVNLERVNKA
jgi:hypothetical protein